MNEDSTPTEEYIETEKEYGANNYKPLPVVINRGDGVYVWDVDGKKYYDCLSAYSALNFGHKPKEIIDALNEQLQTLHLTSRAFYNNILGNFMKVLCEITGFEKMLPMNTGAEAVETAIKIARRWGYRKKGIENKKAEIIVCEDNFHGRTTTIVGFSSDPNSCNDFGPATPGFKQIPFNDVNALENAINPHTAAFLVEPIQGEAGIIVPDDDYLPKVTKICKKNNVLLILDEIQTGLGRTGKNFAYQHYNIKPDILCLGKALGGGIYPVSAALTSNNIMQVITPGSHGSTFGGNPLGAKIGIKSIELLIEKKLAERAEKLGKNFLQFLEILKDKTDKIREVRGKGLLLAVEFHKKSGLAREYVLKLKEKGVLVKDTHGYTIRIAPPLIITDEQLNEIKILIEQVFLAK